MNNNDVEYEAFDEVILEGNCYESEDTNLLFISQIL